MKKHPAFLPLAYAMLCALFALIVWVSVTPGSPQQFIAAAAGLIGSIGFGIRAYRLAPARIDRQP